MNIGRSQVEAAPNEPKNIFQLLAAAINGAFTVFTNRTIQGITSTILNLVLFINSTRGVGTGSAKIAIASPIFFLIGEILEFCTPNISRSE